MTLATMTLLDLVFIVLLDAVVVRPIARRLRRRSGARRLGQLPIGMAAVDQHQPPVEFELPPLIRRWFEVNRSASRIEEEVAAAAETSRHTRLRQLGEAGTYRVHNCGRILHVDYDRGELIVERDVRHR
jgi:hypothetical protein